MNKAKLSQSTVVLMAVIFSSKLIGIFRDIVLANCFGTTNISDAYLIASTVPTLLFYFIGHSLSTSFIPVYNKVRIQSGEKEGLQFANNLLNAALILSMLIVVVLLVFTRPVVKVFAAGFDHDTTEIAVRLIRISCCSVFFMTTVNICSGYLQANRSFLIPAAISVPRNFVLILSVVIGARMGIVWLGIGLLLSYVVEFLFLLPAMLRKGYIYRPYLNCRDENLEQTVHLVTPILIGMCVSQVNKIIDRSMASTIIEGGISALSYASVINNSVQEIMVTGIITILFTNCSELVAKKQIPQLKKKVSNVLKAILFFTIPASVGVVVLAEPIVKLFLCRGVFDERSIEMTASCLRCYTMGLTFLAIRETLVKVFYTFQDTKRTTTVSIISICLNICLNFLLGRTIGIQGLAAATTISAAFGCTLLFVFLRKKIGDFGVADICRTMAVSLIGSLLMGMAVRAAWTYSLNRFTEFFSLVLCILAGAVVYFALQLLVCFLSAVFAGKYKKQKAQI